MPQVFSGHGIQLEYPEDWLPHEQSSPDEFTLSINSPATSFWSVTLLFDRPSPDEVVESVLEALREEYTEIDVYDSDERLRDSPTVACDVDFVCHELIGSAFLRAVIAPQFTLLVVSQGADFELEETQKQLDQITKSLIWEVADDEIESSELAEFQELWGSSNPEDAGSTRDAE